MRQTTKLFHSLTARDVMRPAVVVLTHGMSLMAAARLLSGRRIAGAPVIDSAGRCVGVLRAEDFLRWAADGCRTDEPNAAPAEGVWCDWQVVDVQVTRRDQVRWHMTPDPLLVTPESQLAEIAESLLDPRRHPVVVVDEQRRPLGIVSSKGILAALASSERQLDEPSVADVTDRQVSLGRTVRPRVRA